MTSYIALLPGTGSFPEIVVLPFVVAWVWALIDCLVSKRLKRSEKIGWCIALLLLNVIAAVAYWMVRIVAKRRALGAGSAI